MDRMVKFIYCMFFSNDMAYVSNTGKYIYVKGKNIYCGVGAYRKFLEEKGIVGLK